MRTLVLGFLTAAALIYGGGCSSARPETVSMPNLPQATPVNPPEGSQLLTANTYAGDALYKMLLFRMGSGGGIVVASFVDLDDLERTSSFGRTTAQQVGSRLGQQGYRVIEARLADSLALERRQGEFLLTRDARRVLTNSYDAHSALVGCYSNAGSSVFVSARVVRLSDNAVMGAYEYYIPRDGEVNYLLSGYGQGGSGGDGVWEQYNSRAQAFAPGCGGSAPAPAAKRVSSVSAPRRAPIAAQKDQKDTPAVDVPRYVESECPPGKRK